MDQQKVDMFIMTYSKYFEGHQLSQIRERLIALDDSKFDTYDFAVLMPLGARVDLEVNVGSGRSDFFDAGHYGGLLFLVYGSRQR